MRMHGLPVVLTVLLTFVGSAALCQAPVEEREAFSVLQHRPASEGAGRLLFLRCCAILDSLSIAWGPMIDARETSARQSAGRSGTA